MCIRDSIYFSRGTDRDIYLERKKLGEQLVEPVLKAVNYDFANTVFSYVPNTSESAFFGFIAVSYTHLDVYKRQI